MFDTSCRSPAKAEQEGARPKGSPKAHPRAPTKGSPGVTKKKKTPRKKAKSPQQTSAMVVDREQGVVEDAAGHVPLARRLELRLEQQRDAVVQPLQGPPVKEVIVLDTDSDDCAVGANKDAGRGKRARCERRVKK